MIKKTIYKNRQSTEKQFITLRAIQCFIKHCRRKTPLTNGQKKGKLGIKERLHVIGKALKLFEYQAVSCFTIQTNRTKNEHDFAAISMRFYKNLHN